MVGHNIIKCTRTMTKQFANGRITIPCVREDQIYQVRMGSLRLYENGQYATASTNATAVSFFLNRDRPVPSQTAASQSF